MIAIDRSKCTLCGVCVKECPAQARTIAGRSVTAQEVMDVVMKDYKVYLNSGGGMTLSGGEVTGQPEFALRLLKMAKENQIHTAIETCGYVQWEVLRTLLEYTDYVMYEMK